MKGARFDCHVVSLMFVHSKSTIQHLSVVIGESVKNLMAC
jgi:hypothetical protein